MDTIKIKGIIAATLLATSCSAVHASLIDRGNGLIYDDILDITWLQDANLGATETFGVLGVANDGGMAWEVGFNWIDAMNDQNYLGYNQWRMPTLTPVDPNQGFQYTVSYDGSTDKGYNQTSPTNELSHLYYVSLGNLGLCAYSTGNTCVGQPDWGLLNKGPFTNLTSFRYWTDKRSEINLERAFDFDFTFGQTGTGGKGGEKYIWAVLDGDIAAVPVPAAVWLFGSGLLGLVAVGRRRKK